MTVGFLDNVTRNVQSLIAPVNGLVNVNRSTAAAAAQGMSPETFLGPGTPVYPADGVSRFPRTFDFPSGYNIAARPRSGARMSFQSMRTLIANYDIASIAISHRVAALSSYDWSLVPLEGYEGDLSREIAYVKQMLRKPDGTKLFRPWLREYARDILSIDAGTLYKIRTNAGHPIGLKIVDGATIAPLLDGWGDRPTGDAPAYVQFTNGINWNWLLDSDIIYQPYQPVSDGPYGLAPIESIVLAANSDLRMQVFLLQIFTEGNIPAGFGMAPETWTPDQVLSFQAAWDALYQGAQEVRTQIKWIPGGGKLEFPTLSSFDTSQKDAAKWLMQKTASAFHVTPDDLGFTEDSNRSVGESQSDVSNKVGDVPLAQHIGDILSSFIQDDIGIPLEFQFDLGGIEEDRLATAQADKIYVDMGSVSPSKIAELRFGITDVVPIPRTIANAKAGPIPVASIMAASPEVDADTALPVVGTVLEAAPQAAPVAAGTLPIAEVAPPAALETLTKAARRDEMAQFAKFVKSRKRLGVWRKDFTFSTVDEVTAHRLNVEAFADIRKGAGEINPAVRKELHGDLAYALAAIYGDTGPAAPEPEVCPCCGGSGEHDTGRECFYCDATGAALGGSGPIPCDGLTNPNDTAGADAVPLADAAESGQLVKSWRDSSNKSPQHEYDLRITDHYSPLVEKVQLGWVTALDIPGLVDRLDVTIQKAAGDELDLLVQRARQGLTLSASELDQLRNLLEQVVGDGFETGAHGANLQLAAHSLTAAGPLAVAVLDVDWANWKPGNPTAAATVVDGALRATLDSLGITVKGVADSTLDLIGNRIGAGLAEGLGGAAIERQVRDLLGGSAGKVSTRAERIVYTEVARAQTAASFAVFRASGVTQYDLVVSDGACPVCLELAADGPYPLGDDAALVPIHPFCRCANTPVPDSIDPDLPQSRASDDDGTGEAPLLEEAVEQEIEAPVETQTAADRLAENYTPASRTSYDEWTIPNKTVKVPADNSDPVLAKMLKQQGFDGLPTKVDAAELKDLVKQGGTPIFRGISGDSHAEYADAFLNGDLFAGRGTYGNGTYFSSSKVDAQGFAGKDGSLLAGVLSPDAKVAKVDDLVPGMLAERDAIRATGALKDGAIAADMGRYAASLGYDAIYDGNYYVVLNRTALAVEAK